MVALYNRALSLYVGSGGQGLELNQFHVKFTVHHRTTSSFATLECRVYNLSDQTVRTIQQEFTEVKLMAGYSNDTGTLFGTIFQGSIVYTRSGHENATDSFIDIFGADGDIPRNWASMNKTLAKGHTQQQVQDAINGVLSQYGATPGYTGPLGGQQMPRGRVLYGHARDIARDFANSNGMTWNITNGQIEWCPINGYVPAEAVVLNSASGLVGWPEQTPDGITFRALLNPGIMHNRQVQINNAAITKAAIGTPISIDSFTAFNALPSVAADGYYRVLAADHIGDTRGQAWYTDGWCVAINGTYPLSQTAVGMDIDGMGQMTPQSQAVQEKLNAPLAVPQSVPEN